MRNNDNNMEKMELEEVIYLIQNSHMNGDAFAEQLASLKGIVRESREYNNETITLPQDFIPRIVEACPLLEYFDLRFTDISDLAPLTKLKKIKTLWLERTQVSNLYPITALTELENIRLDSTEVFDLHCLANLTKLKELRITNTNVKDITPISTLASLETLWLDETQIIDCSPLSALKNLKTLSLNRTSVVSVQPLSRLTRLVDLHLGETKVFDLFPLVGLSSLRNLWLDKTPVQDLQPLGQISSLRHLWLNGTLVHDLQPLAALTKLERLSLDATQVRDLEPLRNLKSLQMLSVRKNHLDYIPAFFFEREMTIVIKETTIAQQPEALFQLPREQILQYYYNQPKCRINESKVIFIGDAGVGKTYTIRRILANGAKRSFKTEATPGIMISTIGNSEGSRIHFWDFGGQEIMHSMHQFFLTERTCYVVTVGNREPNSTMAQAKRWLRVLAGLSDKVSIILAVNCWHYVPAMREISESELYQICPHLTRIVYYSAKDDSMAVFNQRITDTIFQAVRQLDSFQLELPLSWAEILRDLQEMQADYITLNQFRSICANHGLDGSDINTEAIRMWLLEWFNDMGVCFSYHRNAQKDAEELGEYKVLRPTWLTNAIYRIINNGIFMSNQGLLKKDELYILLNDKKYFSVDKTITYSVAELDYILKVMEKFQFSYQISDNEVFIPSLLAGRRPLRIEPLDLGDPLVYSIHLTYLPVSLIHRLMIEMRNQIDDAIWRYGVRLTDGDHTIIVETNEERNIMTFKLFQREWGENSFCRIFHEARDKVLRDCKEMRLLLMRETVSLRKENSCAEYELNALVHAFIHTGGTSDAILPNTEGNFRMFSFSELLYPIYNREALSIVIRMINKPSSRLYDTREILNAITPYYAGRIGKAEQPIEDFLNTPEWRTL